jgi:hexosaminidase
MQYFKTLLILSFLLSIQVVRAQVTIVPLPKSVKTTTESFKLKPDTKIYYQSGLHQQAELLAAALSPATGYDFTIKEATSAPSGIFLQKARLGEQNREAYELEVNKSLISIKGNTGSGVFYGIQSLLQLLPPSVYSRERQKNLTWQIPGVKISDSPEYPWRGMMLDVGRYFFSTEYVKRFVDMMAMYKMNTLHFHLTDDNGWRIEIKKYPKLTEVGAWRGKNEKRNGGYYTQDDIRDIVAYAAARNVEVIPEIEMPAHAMAAIAAYPHLGCTGEQFEVPDNQYISKEIFCAGKHSTFDFLQDVLTEVFGLFPSHYIHIGGDEANYERWKSCPECQKLKKELNLKNESELQVYMNRRIQAFTKKYNRTIVGWDEIIEDGLKEKAVGMVWHNPDKALKAVEMGHDVVFSLTKYLYFDMAENAIPGEVQMANWVGLVPMEKTYQLNLMPAGIEAKHKNQVLGASATIWSDQFNHGTLLREFAPLNENRSEKYSDYMTLPRLSALAEVVWTPKSKQDWADFQKRMSGHYARYQHAGYGFRLPQPVLTNSVKTNDGYQVTLKNVVDNAEIRYTVDGTYPNPFSKVYTGPFNVKSINDFKAIIVLNRSQYSLPLFVPDETEKFKKYGTLVGKWNAETITGKTFSPLTLDLTGKIDASGSYKITFLYTYGSTKLEIKSVELYKNGQKVAEDVHDGAAGGEHTGNVYHFKVPQFETGAKYEIKAMVRGDIDNNSSGVVMIKKN